MRPFGSRRQGKPWQLGIIYTGGTIGSIGDPLVPMKAQPFHSGWTNHMVPILDAWLATHAKLPPASERYVFLDFGDTLDSTEVEPRDWCRITKLILDGYAELDAFLVLHGTDTLAWTSSALSFLLCAFEQDNVGHPASVLSRPVVLTGSQVPLFRGTRDDEGERVHGLMFNTDALQNVCGAVAAAVSGIPEVCVYFNHMLMRGSRVVKVDSAGFRAFTSPNYPPLAHFAGHLQLNLPQIRPVPPVSVSLETPSVLKRQRKQLESLEQSLANVRVVPYSAHPTSHKEASAGSTASQLEALIGDLSGGAVVLRSYGSGNFPSGRPPGEEAAGEIYQILAAAHWRGTVVVDCTQVLAGGTSEGTYAAGTWLADVGAVGAVDMTQEAVHSKAAVLLALLFPQNRIEELLTWDVAGEVTDPSRLQRDVDPFLAPGERLVARLADERAELENDPKRGPLLSHNGRVVWPDDSIWTAPPPKFPGKLLIDVVGRVVFVDRDGRRFVISKKGTKCPCAPFLQLVLSARGPVLQVVYRGTRMKRTILYAPAE